MLDETQSTEVAFSENKNVDDTFKFDEEKPASPASQAETENKETASPSSEEKENEDVEQRVPYSRFKSVVEERDEFKSTIQSLEERLSLLETTRQTSQDEVTDVPAEWKELYGDSDVSKRAFQIQLAREKQLQEQAVEMAIEKLRSADREEKESVDQNLETIEENLSSLQETIGRKLTPKQEEELLSIVDEFSPTDDNGKYVTLFPFDKAYEIYELRNSKSSSSTVRARKSIADITGTASEGEVDSSSVPFERGWDNWRKAL